MVGSSPVLTPHVDEPCTPIQMPMPCATSAGKERSSATAWRPMTKARWTSRPNRTMTTATTDKPQFLGDHREQEVGMRLGQIEEFLDAGAQPDAEQFAAPKAISAMRQLVAAPEGVGPRVHEAEDAVAA